MPNKAAICPDRVIFLANDGHLYSHDKDGFQRLDEDIRDGCFSPKTNAEMKGDRWYG